METDTGFHGFERGRLGYSATNNQLWVLRGLPPPLPPPPQRCTYGLQIQITYRYRCRGRQKEGGRGRQRPSKGQAQAKHSCTGQANSQARPAKPTKPSPDGHAAHACMWPSGGSSHARSRSGQTGLRPPADADFYYMYLFAAARPTPARRPPDARTPKCNG